MEKIVTMSKFFVKAFFQSDEKFGSCGGVEISLRVGKNHDFKKN